MVVVVMVMVMMMMMMIKTPREVGEEATWSESTERHFSGCRSRSSQTL